PRPAGHRVARPGPRNRKVSDRGGAPRAGSRAAAPRRRHEPVPDVAGRFTRSVFLRSSMSFHMKNAKARRGLSVAAASLFAVLASVAHADWGGLNMPEGVTILSREIYKLHMLILWVCVAIAVVVFGVMIYSIFRFRKSQGAEAD